RVSCKREHKANIMALAGCPDYFLRHSNYQETMERTSSRRPEELIVSGFHRSAGQALPQHHGNVPLSSTSNLY
ncbi:hypothetical protein ATANTOWER_019913, partial [Ataeniobius toweri]|nr:hypothetical protein [Ataeniobius toweri]